MSTHRLTCPGCRGPVIVRLDGFPLNSTPGNQNLHLKCPLCGRGLHVGYVAEPYDQTAAREVQQETKAEARWSDDTASGEQSASSGIESSRLSAGVARVEPDSKQVDGWDDDSEVEPDDRSPNDDRSDSMNPNNDAYQAVMDNRSDQMNPNNPAYDSSRGR